MRAKSAFKCLGLKASGLWFLIRTCPLALWPSKDARNPVNIGYRIYIDSDNGLLHVQCQFCPEPMMALSHWEQSSAKFEVKYDIFHPAKWRPWGSGFSVITQSIDQSIRWNWLDYSDGYRNTNIKKQGPNIIATNTICNGSLVYLQLFHCFVLLYQIHICVFACACVCARERMLRWIKLRLIGVVCDGKIPYWHLLIGAK